MSRCCFYMDPWVEVDPNLENFKIDCALPTTTTEPWMYVSCSVGENEGDFYTKLESDYFRCYKSYLDKIHAFLWKVKVEG